MPHARLKDWCDVDAGNRPAAFDLCRAIANEVQARLAPFVELCEDGKSPAGEPIAGLPYAAKDMFTSPDRSPTWGLAAPVQGLSANQKAAVLERLDNAGARCVGFTRMTALAYEPSGVNPLQGTPKNPWNEEFATGASSSGSAVAVGSGAAFVALGSDTAGSLRVPAQGCGLTSWKPTHGTVSDDGAMPLSPSMDAIGLLARSARDIEAVAPVLAPELAHWNEINRPVTILALDDALAASHAAVRNCCEQALRVFSDLEVTLQMAAGLQIVEDAGSEAMTVMQHEAAASHKERLDDPDFDPMLARRLGKGLEISDAVYSASLAKRQVVSAAFHEQILGSADMIALPVMPIRTPPLSETDPASASFQARTLYALSAFSRFVNYLGLPAVALPVGFDDRGMPVALQLVGRAGSDMMLIATAARLQNVTDWHGRLPAGLQDMQSSYGDLLI